MFTQDTNGPSCPPSRSFLQYWITCRSGWLIEVYDSTVVAVQPWPDLRAWRRQHKGASWHPIILGLRVRCHEGAWHGEMRGVRGGSRNQAPAQQPIRCRMEDRPFIPRQVLTRQESADPSMSEFMNWDDNDNHDFLKHEARVTARLEADRKMVTKYIQQIPGDVLDAVAGFPENHWCLLRLAAFGVDAMRIIETSPGLAMALSTCWVFREISITSAHDVIREMLGKRQIEIAEWLGFPGVGRSVEVIRKLPPQECTVANLLNLRNRMGAADRLHQLPSINTTLLRTLAKEGTRVRLSEDYLEELGTLTSETSGIRSGDDWSILRDVQWMRRRLGDRGVIEIRSREQLRRFHDSLLERFGRTDLRILNRPPLPPPPLDPSCQLLNIEAVTTEEEVMEEAKQLDGGTGGYLPRILKGELYIYRVNSPEAIIFTVHRWRDGHWRLQEIKRREGDLVGKETMEAVFDWLDVAHGVNAMKPM